MKTNILKNFFAFFTFFISISLFAQNSGVKVVDLKPEFNHNKFPEIQIINNEKVQNKINTSLQLEYLEHLPNVFKFNPYEELKTDDENHEYIMEFYGWKVNESPKNILSIAVEAEYTGPNPEGFMVYENYDLRNGNQITVNNIFTQEGIKILGKVVNDKINLKIKNFIEELNQIKPANNEEKETIKVETEVNKFCMKLNESYPLEFYKCTFENDKITFLERGTSNRGKGSKYKLDVIKFSFTFKELEKFMTDYGKNLCFNQANDIKSSSIDGKMFKGKIDNKYSITALVKEYPSNKGVYIYYWYDKYNQPIEWIGKFENNQFKMKEENENNQEILIEANYIENKIIGNWKNKTTNKTLKLELIEY